MEDRPRAVRCGRIAAAAVVALVVLVALGGVVSAHGGHDGAHHHDGWMGTHDGGWAWMVGGLWMVVWTLVVVGAVAVLTSLAAGKPGGGDEALEVLRERYAAGEIDEAVFEDRRARLASNRE